MARSFLSKSIWYFRHGGARLGVAGSLGLGLLASSMVFALAVIAPEKKQMEDSRHKTEALLFDVQSRKVVENKTTAPAEQLATFYKSLPKANSAPDWLNKIYDAAKSQNLTLEQGEYHLARDPDGKVLHYEITLPIKGGYVQIRKFVKQVLNDVPSLSLDSLSFQRQRVGEATIQTQVKFILFMREGR